jgi:tripartite-type tricarboxylate transporter receptor subunit TctC
MVLALAAVSGVGQAQGFPAKPIRILVPYPPGGATDPLVRLYARKLGERWGQQVVVDHRPGAGGNIASELTARALPDGYTVLLGTVSTLCINPALYANLPFDTVRDFTAVSLLASGAYVLIAHTSLPARSVPELIAYARAQRGQLNYASGGSGGAPHLAMELLKSSAGFEATHVPYKGAGPALIDVLAGQVPMMFAGIAGTLQHLRAGRIVALAVTGRERSAILPEVPTVAQGGLPGYEVDAWYGLTAPAGLPSDIVSRLNQSVAAVAAQPDTRDGLAVLGLEAHTGSPGAFAALIRADLEKWSRVVKASGARAD